MTSRIMPADGYLAVLSGVLAGTEISVTRALGHKHLEAAGVLAEPSVSRMTLSLQDCCIIVATDGIW